MKRLIIFIMLIFSISAFAEEKIITGNLFGSGLYIQSDEDGKVFNLMVSDLTNELMDLSGQKVRMLCEAEDDNCTPIRYEIAPFLDETNLEPWSIKKIPKYVYGDFIAFNPTVTPDSVMLFWTVLVYKGNKSTQKIWYSERDAFGFWKKGKQMSGSLNNEAPSAIITALPGGNELFVFGSFSDDDEYKHLKKQIESEKTQILKSATSLKDYEDKMQKVMAIYNREIEKIQNKVPLYRSFRENTDWSKPKSIQFPDFYNLYRSEENPSLQVFGGCTLSSSGRVIIYSAKHKDSLGKLDLYVSESDNNGVFSLGKNMGNLINTAFEEMAPFLAADDRTLYFSSQGHKGLSIYVSHRKGENWLDWSPPQEISTNLKGVNFFSIPASGSWAYISKKGKLLMTYLPMDMKPNPVIVIKGQVVDDSDKPLAASIAYESLVNGSKIGSTVSDPSNGNFSLVLPFGENYGYYAEKEGYIPVHGNTDLRKVENKYREIEVKIVLPKIEIGKQITINNLFFQTASYEITKESEAELDRLGEIMTKNKTVNVLIEGHTDNRGDGEANQILSLMRADSVADYLKKKHNILPERLKTIGLGQEKPIVPNTTTENRAKNRRVVFKIIK
ncbi:MAG: OmpA family protein [Leptospiraceae bacterium]|nr:OmpA family protein [Leptospiraceae bacterium]MCP5495189.1 OmpA family protein [Leptospiraceae bacterium]